MDTELNVYDRPVERYDDGSRELTKAERIEQIGWEISREQLERAANVAAIRAHEIDHAARDDRAPYRIAACRSAIRQSDKRIDALRYELNNLTGATNAPRNDEE